MKDKERRMPIEFRGDAVAGLKGIGKMTGRSKVEVVMDALTIYHWVLEQQSRGKRVVVVDPKGKSGELVLKNYVRDPKTAENYFGKPQT